MRLVIAAVGRMRAGPENDLVTQYCTRAGQAGRALGLRGPDLVEADESRAKTLQLRRDAEARKLLDALPAGGVLVALDERGANLSSQDLATRIARWRDEARPAAMFCIGGPDGHGEDLRGRAELSLAFGAATWPHMLARAMLAEQLYRAVTILAGHPYHRA